MFISLNAYCLVPNKVGPYSHSTDDIKQLISVYRVIIALQH